MKMIVTGGALLAFSIFTAAEAIPGVLVLGIDHVGITVPNIAEAAAFFKDAFGCERVTTIGPFRMKSSVSEDRKKEVAPRADAMTIAMLRCGHGSNIELFEYKNSKGNPTHSNHEDVGFQHIAFYTTDIRAGVKVLRSKGATIIGEPMTMTNGDTAGETWVHFTSPWGLELELVQADHGKGYETARPGTKLWSTKKPAE